MSKWLRRDAVVWPADMPKEYFTVSPDAPDFGTLTAIIVSLINRIDGLESQMARLMPERSFD